jgi:ADP-ribosylglycohydrolase
MGKETLFSEKDLEYAQLYRNPYREWIGAQIRVDSYAYVMPGNPELAAELAYRDARLSHVKNGIYGAMFVAAMISAGFMTANPEDVIAIGLSEIPKTSRLYADVQRGVEIAQQAANLDDLMNDLWRNLGHYHPVHTNNNAALIAAALIYGGDDFERCITTAVVGGWDTDCNGATVGSIWGAMHGARALPEKWTEPLHDTLYSCIPDFHPIKISECAKRSTRLALDFLEHD